MSAYAMSNARGCSYLFLIFMAGIGSCLFTQRVEYIYREAKLCEATQCESIKEMAEQIKKSDMPILKKDEKK